MDIDWTYGLKKKVIVELKAVAMFTDVHGAQLITYLKLGNYKPGLLINFNVQLLRRHQTNYKLKILCGPLWKLGVTPANNYYTMGTEQLQMFG